MKRGLSILLLCAAIAFAGYGIYYRCATASTREMLNRSGGQMEWLRREYHLSDTQFARVEQMHREYTPKCDLMCEKIAKANARLDQVIGENKTVTSEVEAALKNSANVQEECRHAMLGHIYAVSTAMSQADGERYLRMMKTRIIQPGLGRDTAILESAK